MTVVVVLVGASPQSPSFTDVAVVVVVGGIAVVAVSTIGALLLYGTG